MNQDSSPALSESQTQRAARELLYRRSVRASLGKFREHMASTGSIEFRNEPARHHKLILENLERLERGDIRRLLILAPPGSAKSTYSSVQFPLWHLACKPNENILCASNSENLAENFNRRRRNLALMPQWSQISGCKLASDLQGVGHFGTEKEGGMRAAGVGSSIVGFRSHLNILDDPITGIEQALSGTQLDRQWEWFHSEFRTRLVPSGRELIVSTRWAKRDIAGRILELMDEGKEEWTALRLPMLADSDDDPLGRSLGESLWPEYFSPAFIAEKQQNPLLWSTQFQQTPLDAEGSWIGADSIVYEDNPPAEMHYVIAMDLALTVGRGDYTAIVVAGLDVDRRLHIVHVHRERTSPELTVQRIFDLCAKYQPMELLIDDDNASKVFTRLLFELARTRGQSPPPINPQPMRGKDKETRAAAMRGLFLSDSVRLVLGGWNTALQRELTEFPASPNDDQVDALSLIGRRYPLLSSPTPPPRINTDPYAGYMVRPGADGRLYTNATLDEMFEDNEGRHGRRAR
jgi:predicted phage terminase large subunit-like protein